MTSAIKEITIENDDTNYFLFSQFADQKNLSIYLINVRDSQIYFGSSSNIDLRGMAAKLGLPFSGFCDDMLKALSCEKTEDLQFIYALEAADENYEFKWKKVLEEGSIKISLGCVTLQRKELVEALSEFLMLASTSLRNVNNSLQDITKTLHKVEKEKANVETVLEEAVKMKEDLEKEMYTKFLIILNSKKRKIRELHEELETSQNKKSKAAVNNKTKSKEASAANNNNLTINYQAGPSKTTKQRFNDFLLSSDEENPASIIKVNPPRRRRQDPVSKPSKRVDNDRDKTVIYNEIIDDIDESVDGLLDVL